MIPATFVVAEHGLARLGTCTEEAVHQFLDVLDAAEASARVVAWEEVFSVPTDPFPTLSDFLYRPDSPMDRDLRLLLGRRIERMSFWGAAEGSPELEWTDGDDSVDIAPSIGLCVSRVGAEPWALLSLAASPSIAGLCQMRPLGGTGSAAAVWCVVEIDHLTAFWRDSLTRYEATPTEISAASAAAFPRTHFAPEVWTQTNRFEGSWRDVRERLVEVLSGLDDGATAVFAVESQNDMRARVMSATYGVDCSPESPNTHRNATAMRRREAEFDGIVHVCEWHAKLEPHQNRVHFAVAEGRLLVGIFAKHLPT